MASTPLKYGVKLPCQAWFRSLESNCNAVFVLMLFLEMSSANPCFVPTVDIIGLRINEYSAQASLLFSTLISRHGEDMAVQKII